MSTETTPDQYFIGTIQSIGTADPNTTDPLSGDLLIPVEVHLNVGSGWNVQALYNDNPDTTKDNLTIGERVVVLQSQTFDTQTTYIVTDQYRVPALGFLACLFFLGAIIFGRKRGFTSMIGLALSIGVLTFYTVPQMIAGHDPFITATISAVVIAIVSLTIAHGFCKQTLIALTSTLITLFLSLGLAQLFVTTAKLFGRGDEQALNLSLVGLPTVDLRGLLLAGIVIGVLGVLDDVTTTQTATVKALADEGETDFRRLFQKGIGVGREHIASLVNTLALAYVGVSLPLLLLFSLHANDIPFWILLNTEMIAEEIVRTLVGSSALILAVPISTLVAAWYYGRNHRG